MAYCMDLEQKRDLVDGLISEREHLENGTTDAAWVKGVLNDVVADMQAFADEGDRGTTKEKRMLVYGMIWDALLELFNEGGDIAFLCLTLRKDDDMADLYWASICALVLSILLRILFCLDPNVRQRVDWDDPFKKWRWWWVGAAVYLIEPNTGNRIIRKSFKHEEWRYFTHYKTKRDPKSVRAENELNKAIVERNFGFASVLVEDVPELVVEILYLSRKATRGKKSLGPGFAITTCGTVLHLLRHLIEACLLHHKDIQKLRARSLRDKRIRPIDDGTKLDKKIRSVAKHARGELQQFNLNGCCQLEPESLIAAAELCPNLTEIDLSRCQKLNDECLKALGTNCRHLTKVVLQSCSKLTNNGIRDLAEGCPHLTKICLRGCCKITDEGVKTLARKCPGLEEVNLVDCMKITDKSMRELAANCPNLAEIYVEGCLNLTEEGVEALFRGCPNLKSVTLEGCDATETSGGTQGTEQAPRLRRRKFSEYGRNKTHRVDSKNMSRSSANHVAVLKKISYLVESC